MTKNNHENKIELENQNDWSTLSQIKTRSFKKAEENINISFQENNRVEHADVIWNASIRYIQASLGNIFPKEEGFNHQKFKNKETNYNQLQHSSITQLIKNNNLMTIEQRKQFLVDLQNQKFFQKTLSQLASMLNEIVMKELLYVSYIVWQKYLIFYQNTIKSQTVLPKFSLQYDVKQQKQEYMLQESQQIKIQLNTIITQSNKISENLTILLINNPQIKIINLSNIQINYPKQQLQKQFQKFIFTIVLGIFLSIEEYFQFPDLNQQSNQNNSTLEIGNNLFSNGQNSSFDQEYNEN